MIGRSQNVIDGQALKINRALLIRTETKFLVAEATARAISERLAVLCERDEHTPAGARDYASHSLYFDSPTRSLYRAKVLELQRQLKLRVRYYDDGPVWLEVKRKDGELITKSGCPLDRARWPRVLQDYFTEKIPGLLAPNGFLDMIQQLGGEPVCRVHYRREAWVSLVDDDLRITFDRDLRAEPAWGDLSLSMDPSSAALMDNPWDTHSAWGGSPVIMEIKTSKPVPAWMAALVDAFRLTPQGISKFAMGVEASDIRSPDLRTANTPWRPVPPTGAPALKAV